MRRVIAPFAIVLLAACGDDYRTHRYPYEPGETRIIGGSDADGDPFDNPDPGASPAGTTSVGVFSGSCELDEACDATLEQCSEGETADVIVGTNGEVLDVLCYPVRDSSVVILGDDVVEDPELGNNTVVVIDGADDGVDIEGDVAITGNNVILHGEGPDVSVIGGDLDIAKNNAIVRGVRIQGDVTLSMNNTSLVWCVIEGDLNITMNNTSVALCEVWGNVNIIGLNTVFVSNAVQGDQQVSGKNLYCNDNHRFSDLDGDGAIDEGEVGAPLECGAELLPFQGER